MYCTLTAPVDVVDPSERPEVIPAPVEDPLTGDDGISDTSAKIRFFLPTEINTNGQVDRCVRTMYLNTVCMVWLVGGRSP